ncbi:MAG: hypothetical protein KIT22_09440 [Verrucomicrobiae bacterium]|nr:hypothetical protein [Verrucomicrobiae bacterium]
MKVTRYTEAEAEAEAEAEKKGTPYPRDGNHPIEFPPELDTPAFREAWAGYEAYRKQRRSKPLLPVSATAKLAELAGWGESVALEAIRETISNGWQGIFRPKGERQPNGRRVAAPCRSPVDPESAKF